MAEFEELQLPLAHEVEHRRALERYLDADEAERGRMRSEWEKRRSGVIFERRRVGYCALGMLDMKGKEVWWKHLSVC